MVSIKKLVKMIQPGQLLRTKYFLKDNKGDTVFGKYPHEAIVSYVPTKASRNEHTSILDAIKVIHFTSSTDFDEKIVVKETSLRRFLVDSIPNDTEIESEPSPFPAHEIVQTAFDLIGADGYILRKRNCQSFARHCYFGRANSPGVRVASRLIAGSVVAAALIIGSAILWVGETSSRTPFV